MNIRDGDYIVIITFSSHPLFILQMDWKKRSWSKYLLLYVHLVIKIVYKFGNFTLSFGKLRQSLVL